MQFTLPLLSLLAATALAAPSPAAKAAQLEQRDFGDALDKLKGLQANGCSVIKCAAALAPTVVGCAAAAAQEFIDPISDAACIAAGANAAINEPTSCTGCF
ncbi:MAG: hypothetical protein MMC23_004347 [Stictis urceolatum]|nr:hypothetical protein [Stictis urceolata]